MDKALGFEPRDCGFESRQDLIQFFFLFRFVRFNFFKVAVGILGISFIDMNIGHFFHQFLLYKTPPKLD